MKIGLMLPVGDPATTRSGQGWPPIRDLALAGLTLAAQSVIDNARPKAKAGEAEPGAGPKPKLDGLDLGLVIHAAVAEGARRFLEGFEEGAAAAAPKPSRPRSP